MQAHADAQVGFVDEGADVNVALPAVGFEQLERDLRQALGRVLAFHAHHPGGVEQAAVVIHRAEDVHLLLLAVPVAAQSPKNCRPVIESVGGHADLGVLERDDLTHKIRVPREIHEHLHIKLAGWYGCGYYT